MKQFIQASLMEAKSALEDLISSEKTLHDIEEASRLIIHSFSSSGRVFTCGNGGSMCDAMHFAEELTGRYRDNRKPYPAIAINDPSHMTCVSNDFGYDSIFSRYIEAHGREGDCLIAISTSGNSVSVINAAKIAKQKKLNVIVLTGQAKSDIADLADVYICTPGGNYADRVQELHIKVLHILIELIERKLHPENYIEKA